MQVFCRGCHYFRSTSDFPKVPARSTCNTGRGSELRSPGCGTRRWEQLRGRSPPRPGGGSELNQSCKCARRPRRPPPAAPACPVPGARPGTTLRAQPPGRPRPQHRRPPPAQPRARGSCRALRARPDGGLSNCPSQPPADQRRKGQVENALGNVLGNQLTYLSAAVLSLPCKELFK